MDNNAHSTQHTAHAHKNFGAVCLIQRGPNHCCAEEKSNEPMNEGKWSFGKWTSLNLQQSEGPTCPACSNIPCKCVNCSMHFYYSFVVCDCFCSSTFIRFFNSSLSAFLLYSQSHLLHFFIPSHCHTVVFVVVVFWVLC